MICTVTTLKDTLPHVQRFVEGNLAQGVDLMFVFLDMQDETVEAYLDQHSCVVLFRANDWWSSNRPAGLNARQRVNAYFVGALLSGFEWADWLFHIDGDEIALIDAATLEAAPSHVRAVKLHPLESVSAASGAGEVTAFKRLLDENELLLLQALGMLKEPDNSHYFHGHVNGKSGIRPAVDIRLGAHVAVGPDDKRVPYFEHPDLRHLHFESDTPDEFVRKWTALVSSGPLPAMRKNRRPIAGAVTALSRLPVDSAVTRKYLDKIYAATTADDVASLSELGLLETIDARLGQHEPQRLSQSDQERLAIGARRLAAEPRRIFHSNADPAATEAAVARALRGL